MPILSRKQILRAQRLHPVLDWRDPDMPVLGKSGRPIAHEKMQLKAQMAMGSATEPHFTKDQTYNLRRR